MPRSSARHSGPDTNCCAWLAGKRGSRSARACAFRHCAGAWARRCVGSVGNQGPGHGSVSMSCSAAESHPDIWPQTTAALPKRSEAGGPTRGSVFVWSARRRAWAFCRSAAKITTYAFPNVRKRITGFKRSCKSYAHRPTARLWASFRDTTVERPARFKGYREGRRSWLAPFELLVQLALQFRESDAVLINHFSQEVVRSRRFIIHESKRDSLACSVHGHHARLVLLVDVDVNSPGCAGLVVELDRWTGCGNTEPETRFPGNVVEIERWGALLHEEVRRHSALLGQQAEFTRLARQIRVQRIEPVPRVLVKDEGHGGEKKKQSPLVPTDPLPPCTQLHFCRSIRKGLARDLGLHFLEPAQDRDGRQSMHGIGHGASRYLRAGGAPGVHVRRGDSSLKPIR